MSERMLKLREVREMTGLSTDTIYRWMKEGRFPRQVQLGPMRVAWRQSELHEWMASRPARDRAG